MVEFPMPATYIVCWNKYNSFRVVYFQYDFHGNKCYKPGAKILGSILPL